MKHKIVSKVNYMGRIIREVTETEGDNSLVFYSDTEATFDGEDYDLRLRKVEYNHHTNTTTINWSAHKKVQK